jgi:hypothetical protein
MSDPLLSRRTAGLSLHLAWLLPGLFLLVPPARGDSLEPRVAAGHCRSGTGTLLSREGAEQPWRIVAEGDAIHSRDTLLALPGMQAQIETQPEGIRLGLRGNFPKLSDFPGLESAVILHDSRSFDIDFSLLRGRVVLTNRKARGPARAWVRVLESAGEITLLEPGDEVALEIYGRWPRGVPFHPLSNDRPTTSLAILALKGQADLRANDIHHRITAPPGPAYFHWDSVAGPDVGPERRDRLPAWADPDAKPTAEAEAVAEAADAFRAAAGRKGLEVALAEMLTEPDGEKTRLHEQFAVLGLAALGHIGRVVEALADPHRPAARAAAVLALRNWIGASAGRDLQLYQSLLDRHGYSKPQAETILLLLHTPFAADQPDTYEVLIAYLQHSKLAVRELAWWHLTRLVASDQLVAYDPAGSPEERARAAAAWKKLIPSGSLPPRKKE